MSRSLLTGEWAQQLDSARDLIVHTRVPEKYMLIDLENGRVFRGTLEGESYWEELPSQEAIFQIDMVRQNSGLL